MNESRKLYLKTYGAIDKLDHLIQNCNMGYRSWKYWHAPMLHAKSMAVVIAYDIYLECCEGLMRAGEWKQEKPVDFYRFREKRGRQMLTYSPKNRKYIGDERFRVSTTQHVARRLHHSSSLSSSRSTSSNSTLSKESIAESTGKRLCGNLCPLIEHAASVKTLPNRNSKICVVCGKLAYHYCLKCVGPDGNAGVTMHAAHSLTKHTDAPTGVSCFFHYHNTNFFGLAKTDFKIQGIKKDEWKPPTHEEQKEHSRKVRKILERQTPAQGPGII